MEEEETFLEPDEKTVAFERGYAVYEMLWQSMKTFQQLPTVAQLLKEHTNSGMPEVDWHNNLTFTDRIGEKVKVELCWYRDPQRQGQIDFNLFVTADRTSKGMADVRGRCFIEEMCCTIIETEIQRAQFNEKQLVTRKGEK